ncbi:MAG: phenylalanine--tRNA ligase subunit alpha [Pirellulales bacterium]
MADEILLNEAAYAVWQTVKERGPIELGEVVKLTGIDQAQVSAAATEAAGKGFFAIEDGTAGYRITLVEGANEILKRGLPEHLAVTYLKEVGGEVPINDFLEWAKPANIAPNEVFKWGVERKWLERLKGDKGVLIRLTDEGRKWIGKKTLDEELFEHVADQGGDYSISLKDAKYKSLHESPFLAKRPEIAKFKVQSSRTLSLTSEGNEAFKSRVKQVLERNSLTPEDLESGTWREIKLRPYDVTLAARDVYPAKIHPLRKIIEQTRRAFLEMGFAEVVSPMVESAFWNFDALFQPQDHPAREMQDTFYMRHPAEVALPGEKSSQDGSAMSGVVEQVRQTHEDGWETGSEGWGYKWSPERSRQVVLRTHTTAATIRALAKNPNPPGKFFCVGWTYRNETISFKHLPVFHQVDGIIIDEEANLASLMGTLQEFYSKMGFGRVKFKPAFYPYTEPSVDVVVYMESRGKWLEMGGAGIFRPEVTLPLGCKHPVLAWGLGIERLAMLRFGLSDIRELYRPSLDALEGVPLCR